MSSEITKNINKNLTSIETKVVIRIKNNKMSFYSVKIFLLLRFYD